jgi:cysteine desulfurase
MINLDHHATTPVLPEVWEAMLPYLTEPIGNPSSAHALGRKARRALEDAREHIAKLLGAYPDEVIFTSGATEANNLAIFGLAGEPPAHILAAPIEHPCVIEPLRQLAARGFEVEWLPVQPDGTVSASEVSRRSRVETRLIALMLVNHETGAVQPVRAVCDGLTSAQCHCDAAQAVGKMPVAFHELGVASLAASGHKFGAPPGIGLLLLRRSVRLRPLFFGGHQQQDRRPGTESVALAVGLATALAIAHAEMEIRRRHVEHLRGDLLSRLRAGAAPVVVNSPDDGSPYVLNVSFPGCRAELLLMKLDLLGVACSTGSACSSGSLLPSPVLQSMKVSEAVLESAMRFSFGTKAALADVGQASERIIKCANELRRANC